MSKLMPRGYLYDREATKKSMDENGYFKTGDIARREGKYYFIMGRASIDSKCWSPYTRCLIIGHSHKVRGIQAVRIGHREGDIGLRLRFGSHGCWSRRRGVRPESRCSYCAEA